MRKLLFFLLLSGLIALAGCGTGEKERPAKAKQYDHAKFVVAGSGTNLPITVKLAEGYAKQAGVPCEVPPSIGTDGAIMAVRTGALELGLVSRPLTPQEADGGLKTIPYALVGIIFGASQDVPDDNLTFDELLKIHQGAKTQWSDGQTINVIIRERHDSSNRVLYAMIPGWKEAIEASVREKRWHIAYKDADVPPAIRSTPAAIGLTDSTEVFKPGSRIKALRINDVVPSVETIADNTYPLSKMLYFLYKDQLTDRSKSFIDFVRSETGAKVILANGGIPARRVE